MKKTDIAMIILIAAGSMIIAFFIGRAIFGETYNATATIKTADKISSEVVAPDEEIFNKEAINPAVRVQISGSSPTTTDTTTTTEATNNNDSVVQQ